MLFRKRLWDEKGCPVLFSYEWWVQQSFQVGGKRILTYIIMKGCHTPNCQPLEPTKFHLLQTQLLHCARWASGDCYDKWLQGWWLEVAIHSFPLWAWEGRQQFHWSESSMATLLGSPTKPHCSVLQERLPHASPSFWWLAHLLASGLITSCSSESNLPSLYLEST